MASLCRVLVLILIGLTAISADLGASEGEYPEIRSLQRRIVYVIVPSGYESVTLQQRDRRNANTWRILATRKTEGLAGVYRIVLKRQIPRRGLFVSGTRVRASTPTVNGPVTRFLADPALASSSGFIGVGGATPGVVALSRATLDSIDTINNSSASASVAREVEESDIWRIDGDRLYFFNQLRGLQVFDIANPDAPILLGQLREPNRGEQMYLLDANHVALLTRASYFVSLANRPFSLADDSPAAYDATSGAIVIADVSGGKPGAVVRISYPGSLVESRLVGTSLYLVTHVYGISGKIGLLVSSYDLSNPAEPRLSDRLELGSYGNEIAATDRFLFVVRSSDDWRRSVIDVIDISASDGTLAQRGQILLAGQVPDKFKINLKGDVLTVVSAVPRNWSGNGNAIPIQPRTEVESFSLARPDDPVRLGSLALGVGETVHATRFSGNRLYVVTFLTIDPLWVVDLTDPANPTLLGELEVPGFSTYIEPIGDQLVGIGRVDSRTAVSLFDVSDPSSPELLSQLPLGDDYSYSEANWDEKAFSVFPDDGLVLVPYSGYDQTSGWASRIQLIDLGRDTLTKRGIVEQGFAARRTAVLGNRIIAISSSDLITVNFADRDHPAVTSDVEIAWRVDRVFHSGDYVIEIGGSADWTRSSPPSLTIASAADPDATVNFLELENVPVTGATVRNGKLYLSQQGANVFLPIYKTAGVSQPETAANPLILSVYDVSSLPEVTRIGRTQADVDPGYGYGAGQLEPAWPAEDTLVWVREQWSSWWWYDVVPVVGLAPPTLANDTLANVGSLSTLRSVSLDPSGSMTLVNANLDAVGASPASTGAGRSASGDAGPATSSLAVDSARMIAPWYRTSAGHEMVVFDVSDPTSPRYTATVDVRIGNTGDWSAPVAVDKKLYLSSMAYDGVSDPGVGELSRRYRHFMRTVDFTDVDAPVVSNEVNLPGRLLSVSRDGTTLLTVGCGFGPDGRPASRRAFHTSRYDGVDATLVDQIRTSSAYDPYAIDEDALFVGNWIHAAGSGFIRAWRIGEDGAFVRSGRVAAPGYSSFDTLNGLLVAFGNGLPQIYDITDPERPRHLKHVDASELTRGDLSNADGGAGIGIWQAMGNSGVGTVRFSK
ncbi:MAG: beta-propeller domain-containing protein [Verrucomicrobiae bacterium]|nr:beta-propeller domain-containing protein [Verrucomicrobiae bacterium]